MSVLASTPHKCIVRSLFQKTDVPSTTAVEVCMCYKMAGYRNVGPPLGFIGPISTKLVTVWNVKRYLQGRNHRARNKLRLWCPFVRLAVMMVPRRTRLLV